MCDFIMENIRTDIHVANKNKVAAACIIAVCFSRARRYVCIKLQEKHPETLD